ncbi:unnamed protein product [Trichobilharzia szidati]|nr:unnamed protein product [Trichobilharzia szidati]
MNKNDSSAGRESAQKKAAVIQSVKNFLGIGFGILSTLFVGYLSDKRGRRFALGIILLGEALKVLTVSVVVFFNLSPWIFVLCEILEGVIGGGLLSVSAQLAACIADITQSSKYVAVPGSSTDQMKYTKRMIKKRWLLFTLLDAVITCGMAFANVLSGYMIVHYRFYATMLTCISFLIPLPINLFCMTETRVQVVQVGVTVGENSSNQLSGDISIITSEDNEPQTSQDSYSVQRNSNNGCMNKLRVISNLPPTHFILSIIIFMFSICGITDVSYLSLYLMSEPFLWNTQALGLFVGLRDVSCTLASVLCVTLVVRLQSNQSLKYKHDINDKDTPESVSVSYRSSTTFIDRLKSVDQIVLILLVFFGLVIFCVHQIIMGVAFTFPIPTANIVVYIATIPRFTKSLQISILRTMLSKWTEVSNQGLIMSIIAVIERLGIMISATVLPIIYASTISVFKGSVFLVCACISFLGALLALIIPIYAPRVSK